MFPADEHVHAVAHWALPGLVDCDDRLMPGLLSCVWKLMILLALSLLVGEGGAPHAAAQLLENGCLALGNLVR